MSRRKQPVPKPARYVAVGGLMHARHWHYEITLCGARTNGSANREQGLECAEQRIGCDRCRELIAYARNFPKRFTK